MPVGDDVTLGEIGRNVNSVKGSVERLSAEVHAFQIAVTELRGEVRENTKDIADLQADRKAQAAQRTSDRRLIIAALVAPMVVVVLGLLFQVLLNAAGLI